MIIFGIFKLIDDETFAYYRFIRSIRVMRIPRIFYNISFFQVIVNVLSKSLKSLTYIALLFILFNFIYALIAMNLFPNPLDNINLTEVYGFNTFLRAFVTMFNVITLNN